MFTFLTCCPCSSVTDGLPELFLLHTHSVSWNCAFHLRMELSDGDCFPNLVRNCCWTVVTDRHSWNVSTQNAFSMPFAAILVNCASSGEMPNYCTPHVMKENSENFLIHRCNYIVISQVYCLWQVVKTQTIILNNPLFLPVIPSWCWAIMQHEKQLQKMTYFIYWSRVLHFRSVGTFRNRFIWT